MDRGRRRGAWPAATGSTAGWPGARAPPARGPSSTRWPTRWSCSAPCSPWPPEHHLPWAPVVLIALREVGMRRLPVLGRPPRRLHPGPGLGQDEDPRPGPGHRHLPAAPARPPPRPPAGRHLGRPPPSPCSPGRSTCLDGRRALREAPVRVEIVAVGTELLLGQIADTNSAVAGRAAGGGRRRLALPPGRRGQPRPASCSRLRTALARGDGVIVCGGLGPTQDDITREAIAEVMNVPLVRDRRSSTGSLRSSPARGRAMSENNPRQADVPEGASVIEQIQGTAPGLICPVGDKGGLRRARGPHEMAEMFGRGILPDLARRRPPPARRRSS